MNDGIVTGDRPVRTVRHYAGLRSSTNAMLRVRS